ncbi:DeoR/GlpR transcriptional regulator [Mesorhizobium sp. M7A.T.Ca.TU.009.01.3.2]|uniref:DeoR/GlpR family DNA-binding transcription regulator n=1 Tax=unclassified Mesorhizobium TaxID=325217 RepID=UPI000FCB3738|nr:MULTISPECIES: DeoR/GlpR family DNA-binding transcription regulator [unclassified Mesorhizobium]RUU11897.1 DeoR/GlpR transcriptional regulator [Mesorhizobium sp. M7A.T.Ca.TU.009.01.3.2]RUU80254.1 DeoR/GlpR transcriptional regulator [Mesorhizobium sp. M7A.T.Ca.TU.009.01.3.1]RUV48294.1 DeoR/GlpR transcriptional regulator [Mesorhizobium sp. M7A.F.Ca.MR.228.00.0.0]RWO62675.1 MAG: DeoR/GlpR transcriptional regulator [Mesorhizobium sp.]RUU93799.1 DeoR/GlpR transcriptional regulator [Mesorhizobium 
MADDTASPLSSTHGAPRDADRQRLLAHDRQARILAFLRRTGSLTVAAAAAELAVSDMTIRRDLVELEREGRLVRIHGGAIEAENPPLVAMDSEEPSFDSRLRQRRDPKAAIAAAAAALVSGYRTIALDVGTTTYLMAEHLKDLPHAKVFTNSLRIAAALNGGVPEVYVAGGRVRADEMSTGGPAAIAQFEALWFDVAVIGVSGITADGLFDYSFDDTDMKRAYLRRSGTKIVLCDSAKFLRMSLVRIAPLSDVDILITDAEPPAKIAAALAAAKVDLRIAPPLTRD